jgi:hypothetical protein
MQHPMNPVRKGPRGEPLPEAHDGLPDSEHLGGLCPRCGKQSSFKVFTHATITSDRQVVIGMDNSQSTSSMPLDRVVVLFCRHCDQGTMVIEERVLASVAPGQRPTHVRETWRGIHWWPLPEANLSPDIPADIASAFAEAIATLYANCPRAAVVMARRTLEAVTADKGETTKDTLVTKLKHLATTGVLSPDLADWATEVRKIGNTGAHYDPLDIATMEDARDLVNFLRELLRYLYEMPAELRRRRSSSAPTTATSTP